MTLTEYKIEFLKKQKFKGANALSKIRQDKHKLLITILIGNNLVNISASALATKIAMEYFPQSGVGIAVGIMTFLILVFGEILPKAIATTNTTKISLIIAPVFTYLIVLLYPIIKIFIFINDLIYKTFEKKVKEQPNITEEEIHSFIHYGAKAGAIKSREKELIYNIFKFDDVNVKEVMTPRTDIEFIEANQTIKHALEIFSDTTYSRLPIFEKELDNIIGVIYIKDLIKLVKNNQLDVPVKEIAQKPYFIPETLRIDALFRRLQQKKYQMAIIVDEHGGILGLVTLEDLLEEIVGEIFDETEIPDAKIDQLDENTWLIKGDTDIVDIDKELKMNIPKEQGIETISGHIMKISEKIPNEREKFEDEHGIYTIVKKDKNRILLIKLIKKDIPQQITEEEN